MMIDNPISIYVHIPFCISKCNYCAFYSNKYSKESVLKYVEALKDSIFYFSNLCKNTTVKTIYFGGGTPTSIGAELLCDILSNIKKFYHVDDMCEITVEVNPKTIDEKSALLLWQNGFNRASLGIQTASNERLKLLGRIHTFEDAVYSYQILNNSGFSNISVDLMYGLPETSVSDVIYDIKKILELNPKHISAYALSIEKGTPLFKNKDKLVFPDDDLQFDMYMEICNMLSNKRYLHYEISNFALENFYSIHNSGYWERRDYIGFGPGAHSMFKNKRFFSPSDTEHFIKKARDKNFSSALGFDNFHELTETEKKEEEIMLSLRTSNGLYIPTLPHPLKKFVENGFATYKNRMFSLTDKGFFVSNSIIYYVCKELLYDKK